MVRGVEPARVRLDALERADVVLEIDMPAGSMSVFLAWVAGLDGIEIGLGPKAGRQRREPEPGVKLLRGLDDPFRCFAFETVIDVRGFDQATPLLAPTVVD